MNSLKILFLTVLASVLLSMTGCSTVPLEDENETTQQEEIDENIQQKESLTASDIQSYADSQLPDTYDWRCAYYEEENLLLFVYDGFYLNLMDTQKYLETSKLKTDWYAETNQMIRFNNRIADKLEEMGYDGDVSIMIVDDYQEAMFVVTTGEDFEWIDRVFNVKGSGERK